MATENIHPIFDKTLARADKEKLLKQRGICIWLTGLSGSGKSTIAAAAEKQLYAKGFYTKLLDGDNIRSGINNNLGFSEEDRNENIRRIAEVAKLFVQNGAITFCSFISPTVKMRQQAKNIIGEADFMEVYVNAPLEICEQRDVKGLYAKARRGEIENFTGIDAPFEAPKSADLEIKTADLSEQEAVEQLVQFILPKVILK